MLDELKPCYDLVIVDTPPVLAVTDATLIGKHAGTTCWSCATAATGATRSAKPRSACITAASNMRGVLLTDVPQ